MPDSMITLKGAEWAIEAPTSPSLVYDVMRHVEPSPLRALGAAVAICCPRVRARLQVGTIEQARYDVLGYGGRCVDAMLAQGATIGEISTAGRICIQAMAAVLPTQEEVEDDQDFSEATT